MATYGAFIVYGTYSAADILRLARELGVRGALIRRGRKSETRAYPVQLESGAVMQWQVNAPAEAHS